jgi:hypothetical protein
MNSASLCGLAGRYDMLYSYLLPSPYRLFKNSSFVYCTVLRPWRPYTLHKNNGGPKIYGRKTDILYIQEKGRLIYGGRDGGLGATSWVGETKTMGGKNKKRTKNKNRLYSTQVMCQVHLLTCQVV